MSQDATVQTQTAREDVLSRNPSWIVAPRSMTPFPEAPGADLWDGSTPDDDHEHFVGPPLFPPQPIDWRARAALYPARHQGGCESCVAHALASVMSDLQAIKAWPGRAALSPGFIHWCVGGVDCATALRADVALSGLEEQAVPAAAAGDHPFDRTACPTAAANGRVRLAGPFVRVWGADQARQALQHGPLVAVMDAYADFWEWYGGDVYSPSGVGRSRTHAVAVVGFGADHWIVKNSLGPGWGLHGFAKVRMETCRLLSDGGLPGYVFDIVRV